jgi:Flp pilus assembly protein TadD
MSRTLALVGAGWESVRSSVAHGRRADALARVTRLLARPDLPAHTAAEAHHLAGELCAEAERYPLARRHLRAAAALGPGCARTAYLLGLAHERDPHGCDRRAAGWFRKAVGLEPGNPTYRAAYGRAAVRCGRVKVGARELLAAAAAAPGDVAAVRVVVDGLLAARKFAAARRVLTKARFLGPANGTVRELAGLDERVRFEQARARQGGATRHRQDAELVRDGGRVVLPFIRVAGGGVVRRDGMSAPRPHFPRLRVRDET